MFWHIDRFDSLARARAAVNQVSVAFEAAGTAWLMTIEARVLGSPWRAPRDPSGPIAIAKGNEILDGRSISRLRAGQYSLAHHHSGVEAVYVVEGEARDKTPARGFTRRKARRSHFLPAPKCVPWSAVQRAGMVLAVIVHDAAQPATMRMEEGTAPELAKCK